MSGGSSDGGRRPFVDERSGVALLALAAFLVFAFVRSVFFSPSDGGSSVSDVFDRDVAPSAVDILSIRDAVDSVLRCSGDSLLSDTSGFFTDSSLVIK